MGKDCLFCKIVNREIPAEIVYEDEKVLGFEDINPQAPVHCVFVPKEHIATLNGINTENSALAGELVRASVEVAEKKGLSERGYRVTINCNSDAGQEVFHIHLHLLGGRKFNWPPG
ncbi:MAG: HIT domain-containing protein [Candidatus Omnitrophica bacterium]|nr:HIT domain-containing protein [Candidatus Omnitrophota bacterium]